MKRRGLLVGLAGLLAGAGCLTPVESSGPRTPPRSPEPTRTPASGLVIVDFVDEEGDGGNLRLVVTVENRTGEPLKGTVVATVRAGDRETTVAESVTVEPSSRTEVALPTEIPYDEFSRDGSLQLDVR